MILITDKGHYFTVVEDMADQGMLWVRSQDKRSVQHVIAVLQSRIPIPVDGVTYELIDNADWDYRFRVRLSRELWAVYLEVVAEETSAYKLKPAIAEARGDKHPISKLTEEIFYYMSHNRPDGTLPAWLGGGKRKVTTARKDSK